MIKDKSKYPWWHSLDFSIGETEFRITIKNPAGSVEMDKEIIVAQNTLISVIGDARSQLASAYRQCGAFTSIPYAAVVEPIINKLEKSFLEFQSIMEKHGLLNLFVLKGDTRGFVRSWRFLNSDGSLAFCQLDGKYWFGTSESVSD